MFKADQYRYIYSIDVILVISYIVSQRSLVKYQKILKNADILNHLHHLVDKFYLGKHIYIEDLTNNIVQKQKQSWITNMRSSKLFSTNLLRNARLLTEESVG